MLHTVDIELDGRTITLETGKVAKQANGAVLVRSGDSVVFVSACTTEEPRTGISFFPLTVDYREYTYAAGRFPGGFIKREGRPSEKEILTCRLMDRPIRPLFPEGFSCETQVIAFVLSADPERDPAPLAIVGAAAALAVSDIPFHHVLGAVAVSSLDGKLIANPTYEETKRALLNITVAGTRDGIVMVEAGGQEASEDDVVKAIEFGHQCCEKIIEGIEKLVAEAGKPKREFTPPPINQELYGQIEAKWREALADALNTQKYAKLESQNKVSNLKKQAMEEFEEEEQQAEAGALFDRLKERIFRDEMLKERRRPDGRAFDEIRNLDVEVGVLPRTHGSALFTRGETQALVTCTLGTKEDEQRVELLDPAETSKRFMVHYNFPPFSVGEVAFMRGAGRREIGHGALAERALAPVVPDEKSFPYTMRVVSDIMESNGSSSMATVCGATLSLMDAGVPISAPVAGIAMGLVKEGEDHAILTDNGHQGSQRQHGADEGGLAAGAAGPAVHSGQDGIGDRGASRGTVALRAADLHDDDSAGEDPRSDRSGRQGDPGYHRYHRCEDRRRRRRVGEHFRLRRSFGREGDENDRRHRGRGRGGQDLPGQGSPHRRLRRLCGDLPRHRRLAAHQRDLGEPYPQRQGRAEGRRPDPGSS